MQINTLDRKYCQIKKKDGLYIFTYTSAQRFSW